MVTVATVFAEDVYDVCCFSQEKLEEELSEPVEVFTSATGKCVSGLGHKILPFELQPA